MIKPQIEFHKDAPVLTSSAEAAGGGGRSGFYKEINSGKPDFLPIRRPSQVDQIAIESHSMLPLPNYAIITLDEAMGLASTIVIDLGEVTSSATRVQALIVIY